MEIMESENYYNNIVTTKNSHMYLPSFIIIMDRHVEVVVEWEEKAFSSTSNMLSVFQKMPEISNPPTPLETHLQIWTTVLLWWSLGG